MASTHVETIARTLPTPGAVLELFKPITWFPPMWAFGCGVVSSGANLAERWPMALAGIVLAGPLICATSQAVNDWYDRDVDAINEPNRPIPSGRIPGRWGLWIAMAWTVVSMLWALALGPWVFGAAVVGMILAWVYSAPPLRLKQSGWWGPAACALSYEGITWFTGAAVMLATVPNAQVLLIAAL
jgi:chlorophyll synthase